MGNKSTKQSNNPTDVTSENGVNKGTGGDNEETVVQKMKSTLEKVMESLETKSQETVVENKMKPDQETDSAPIIGNGIEPEKEPDSSQLNIGKDAETNVDNGIENEPPTDKRGDSKLEEPKETEKADIEEVETNHSGVAGNAEELTETIESDARPEEPTKGVTHNNSEINNTKPKEPTVTDKLADGSNNADMEVNEEKDQDSLKEQTDGEEKEKDDSMVANKE